MKDFLALYRLKRIQKTAPYFDFFCGIDCSGLNALSENFCCGTHKIPKIAVVIPALGEFPHINEMLNSLLDSHRFFVAKQALQTVENSAEFSEIAIIIIVNNRVLPSSDIRNNNKATLDCLHFRQKEFASCGLRLIVGDCSSTGKEIPCDQGVGFARKVGLDFALCAGIKLLACLDADTLCAKNYFETLNSCLPLCGTTDGSPKFFAGVTDFFHRRPKDDTVHILIESYERYLKEHSQKLFDCGTPYYPVALGPTIVCSAAAYAACGGMNFRLAGEDFYFLQALIKILPDMHIQRLQTAVYPSSRFSERVPFGTGNALAAAHCGKRAIRFFSDEPYYVLKKWFTVIEKSILADISAGIAQADAIMQAASIISPVLLTFLQEQRFEQQWERLFENNQKSIRTMRRAFFVWFDGLKIIRLFHRFDK